MSILEIISALISIIAVYLTVKQKIICFPLGIVSVALYFYIFYDAKLYADMALQLFYIAMLIYGWYNWLFKKTDKEELKVTKLKLKDYPLPFIVVILFAIALGIILHHLTDASLPYIDALTTSLSLFAQWLVAKKKIENWAVWIIADAIYVGMYIYKELYATSILYLIFIILAIKGLIEWKKAMNLHTHIIN
ncbi:MAG: nicotinamide riboside transporter PnuC [Candidatus Woesearchaeota archaeon]